MNEVYSVEEIKLVAQKIWTKFSDKKIWAFYAEMGAGKTTFIHALCEILEVKNSVTSPTFAIINEYESPVAGIIFHMDWYRLKDEEEARQAGVEDCLYSGSFCLVEWPQNAQKLLPDDILKIKIETVDEKKRRIII